MKFVWLDVLSPYGQPWPRLPPIVTLLGGRSWSLFMIWCVFFVISLVLSLRSVTVYDRYIGTMSGIFRIWPGVQMPLNFDPRLQGWYVRFPASLCRFLLIFSLLNVQLTFNCSQLITTFGNSSLPITTLLLAKTVFPFWYFPLYCLKMFQLPLMFSSWLPPFTFLSLESHLLIIISIISTPSPPPPPFVSHLPYLTQTRNTTISVFQIIMH